MAESGSGIGDKVSDAVERVKQAVGGDDGEREDKVEGRVSVVREALRALGDGDVDRFLEAFSEDVEWVAPKGHKFPGAGTHRGRDAVREKFVDEVQSGFPTFGYRPAHYLETDEWVVTLGDFVGEGRSGGFDVPAAVVWEFDRETVTRVRIHSDSDAFPERVREEDKEQQEEQRREPDREDDQDQPQAREEEDR